jgi:hypothetical protein
VALGSTWWRLWLWGVPDEGYGFGEYLMKVMALVSTWWRLWLWWVPDEGHGFGEYLMKVMALVSTWWRLWLWWVPDEGHSRKRRPHTVWYLSLYCPMYNIRYMKEIKWPQPSFIDTQLRLK